MKKSFLIVLAASVIIMAFVIIIAMPDANDKTAETNKETVPTVTSKPDPSTPRAEEMTENSSNQEDGMVRFDFEKTGNLVDDELVYEEPGRPALRVKLVPGEDSWCDGRKCGSRLEGKYSEGQRVSVKGISRSDGTVSLKYLTQVE